MISQWYCCIIAQTMIQLLCCFFSYVFFFFWILQLTIICVAAAVVATPSLNHSRHHQLDFCMYLSNYYCQSKRKIIALLECSKLVVVGRCLGYLPATNVLLVCINKEKEIEIYFVRPKYKNIMIKNDDQFK